MIVHSIVTEKPPIQAPYQGSSHAPPIVTLSQEDLAALNKIHGLSKGMFVKYKVCDKINGAWSIFYVANVIEQIEDLTYNFQGQPNNVEIVNMGGGSGYIKRKDIGSDFIPLNEAELAEHVTNNDLLLHRVKAFG